MTAISKYMRWIGKGVLWTVVTVFGLISCEEDDALNGNSSEVPFKPGSSETIVEVKDPIEFEVIGLVDEQKGTASEKIGITFSRFPVSVKEFADLRSKIGGTAQGIVALQMMACEMAIHHKEIGRKCMDLVNASSNVKQMEDLFINRLSREEGQGISPYHVAAFLQGTHWTTGYNTEPPYTIWMELNNSRFSSIYQANELEMRVIYNSGSSLNRARFHVIKTKKPEEKPCEQGKYFMIISCGDFLSNASIHIKAYDIPYKGLVPFR